MFAEKIWQLPYFNFPRGIGGIFRYSSSQVFFRKTAPKVLWKFRGKQLLWSPFLVKLLSSRKNNPPARCFQWLFRKHSKRLFFKNTFEELLLNIANFESIFKIKIHLEIVNYKLHVLDLPVTIRLTSQRWSFYQFHEYFFQARSLAIANVQGLDKFCQNPISVLLFDLKTLAFARITVL